MENNKHPDIRFAEFTGDWRIEKFANIVNRVSKQSNANNIPKVEFEDIISGEGRLNKDISNKFDNRKGIIFEPNFILYGKLRPYLKNWLLPEFKGVALGDFWVFEPKDSSSAYIYYLIQTDNYQTVANLSSGTKMPRSDWKTVSETEFQIPFIEEQNKIGDFFKQLDETITLHQQELAILKQTKQGFLKKMFPKEGASVPELRLPGFTGEWDQKKLGDIGSVSMCKRIFKYQTTESGQIPFFKIGTFGRIPDSFISRELFEEFSNKYPYPEIGDVLISASGTIGRTVVYNGEEAYYQDSNIVWLNRNKELVDNSFLKQFYQIVKWAGTEGSTIKRLYNNNILATEIILPSIKEQNKIGNFFKQFDELIALNQKELESLKRTKKAFLQKMFV